MVEYGTNLMIGYLTARAMFGEPDNIVFKADDEQEVFLEYGDVVLHIVVDNGEVVASGGYLTSKKAFMSKVLGDGKAEFTDDEGNTYVYNVKDRKFEE